MKSFKAPTGAAPKHSQLMDLTVSSNTEILTRLHHSLIRSFSNKAIWLIGIEFISIEENLKFCNQQVTLILKSTSALSNKEYK